MDASAKTRDKYKNHVHSLSNTRKTLSFAKAAASVLHFFTIKRVFINSSRGPIKIVCSVYQNTSRNMPQVKIDENVQ